MASVAPELEQTSHSADSSAPRRGPPTTRITAHIRHSPLLLAALSFAAGIAWAHRVWLPPAIPLLLALSGFLLAFICRRELASPFGRRHRALLLTLLASSWCAAGLFSAEIELHRRSPRELLDDSDRLDRKVEGEVRQSTRSQDTEHPSYAIDLAVSRVEHIDDQIDALLPLSTPGGIRLTVYSDHGDPLPALACGDILLVETRLHPVGAFNNPGEWNYPEYLEQQGIDALGSAPIAKIQKTGSRRTMGCMMLRFRAWASLRLRAAGECTQHWKWLALDPFALNPLALDQEDQSILLAILFGDRASLDRDVRLDFQKTGSFHLLVISGLSVAILAGLVYSLMRRSHAPPALSTLVTLMVVAGYTYMSGFAAPAQRALLMISIYMLARLFSRDRLPLNAIGAAALAGLLFHPGGLFEASFQMTFLAVLAIAGIAMPIADNTVAPYLRAMRQLGTLRIDPALPPPQAQFRLSLRIIEEHLRPIAGRRLAKLPRIVLQFFLWVGELLLLSIVLNLALALPMAIYFHRVITVGLPASMLTTPFMALLMPAALLVATVALVSPALAAVPAAFTALLLHFITFVLHTLGHFDASNLRIADPLPLQVAASLIALAGAMAFTLHLQKSQQQHSSSRSVWATASLTALCLSAAIAVWPSPPRIHRGQLEVTAIDVGQGDSLLVVSPEGKTLMVDSGGPVGTPGAEKSSLDFGEQVVSPYLWHRGIRTLDAVALTHAHSDHMGGMASVLFNFRPKELWIGKNPNSAAYLKLLAEARGLGIFIRTLRAGDELEFGGARISVLAPAPGYLPQDRPTNNDSLVLHVFYGSTSALLEGDAEKPIESYMLTEPALHADLLKVGHHGSISSTNPDFLHAVSPRFAVISVGRDNTFGHPRREVLARLSGEGAKVYRTDMGGAFSFLLDGKQVTPAPP